MLPRTVRLLFAFAVFVAAWAFAAPARAAAPLCDRRAASVVAPAPQLQEPLTYIDACPPSGADGDAMDAGKSARDGRGPRIGVRAPPSERVLPEATLPVMGATATGALASHDPFALRRPGERFRIERPPRG